MSQITRMFSVTTIIMLTTASAQVLHSMYIITHVVGFLFSIDTVVDLAIETSPCAASRKIRRN